MEKQPFIARRCAILRGPLIGVVVAGLLATACSRAPSATPVETPASAPSTSAPGTTAAGPRGEALDLPGVRIHSRAFDAREGSGLTASRRYPGVFWAILDSGPSTATRPRVALYAYRIEDGQVGEVAPGQTLKALPIPGAVNTDWEDLARDDQGNLWIADIGDNSCERGSAALLKVREPDPERDSSAKLLATYRFRYPDPREGCKGWNAESLFLVGDVPYVISKAKRSAVYRISELDPRRTVVAKRVAYLEPPAKGVVAGLSGADLSADRRRLAVENYGEVFVYEAGDPSLSGDALVEDLARRPPRWQVSLGCMTCETASQAEGISFSNDTYDLNLLTENRNIWFIPARAYEG